MQAVAWIQLASDRLTNDSKRHVISISGGAFIVVFSIVLKLSDLAPMRVVCLSQLLGKHDRSVAYLANTFETQ